MTKVFPYGAVEVSHDTKGTFKVNGQRLKHYIGGNFQKKNLYQLDWFHVSNYRGQAEDYKSALLGRQPKFSLISLRTHIFLSFLYFTYFACLLDCLFTCSLVY